MAETADVPAESLPWVVHAGCTWKEVPPCVYCVEHGERLYQGSIPAERDPELAAKRAACDHDWDPEMGLGFYVICMECGFREWCE